ncbi:MAG: arylsulfatase [Verrucomicrobiota bacterium]
MKSLIKLIRNIVIALAAAGWFAVEAEEKPNIIFILVDDMGWSDLGCYGSEIETPHIDYLASRGMRFTQMYNTAKCFPSRACLLTGVYAQQSGMDETHAEMKNSVTLGEVLRPAGYRTFASGKHHGTENLYHRGFDHYYGLRDGACNFWNPGVQRPGEPVPGSKGRVRYWCDDEVTHAPYTPEDPDFYTTDAFTNKALEWLDEPETKDKPFLLYLSYTAPHYPLHAWPEDIAKYKGMYDEGYHVIQQTRYERQVEMGLIDPETAPLKLDPKPAAWEALTPEEKRREAQRMEIYAAMLDRVDQNIGRVLEKLRAQGKLDNTLIMFASDNGGCAEGTGAKVFSEAPEDAGKIASYDTVGKSWAIVQNTPFRFYKNYSHEGGICTPFVVSWPAKIKAQGGFNRQAAHFIDIMPTLVEISDAKYPEKRYDMDVAPMQGESLIPAFLGGEFERNEPLFWQWRESAAIREGSMKAVRFGSEWELYDLSGDRNETVDLAAERPETLASLASQWERWYASVKGGE